MEAAASGHEIIVQYLLNHVSDCKNHSHVSQFSVKLKTCGFSPQRKNHKFDTRLFTMLCLILGDSHL